MDHRISIHLLLDESTLGLFLAAGGRVWAWIYTHGLHVPLQHNEQQRSWEWHLLSLRAGRPKIKLLGWAPSAAFTEISWRTNGEIPTQWDARKNPAHIQPRAHMRVYADTPLLHVQPQISTLHTDVCTQWRKKASLQGWIKPNHFVGVNIKGLIFIFGQEELS